MSDAASSSLLQPLSYYGSEQLFYRELFVYSLKVEPVMRLKSKECILENQTDSIKAEDEILYI